MRVRSHTQNGRKYLFYSPYTKDDKEMISDDYFVKYFTEMAYETQGQECGELPMIRKQLADTENGIENMLNAIQAGIINDSAKRRLDELEETKRKLELSIIQEEIKKPTFSYEQIMFYIMSFRNIDTNTLEGRRALIDRFVNSVVVYDDEILINLNYRKGAKRVSFKEIETACAGLDISSLLRPY